MSTLIIFISAATLSYIISTKFITYPDGYTAIQAMHFYKQCKKSGISKHEQCRKKTVKIKEIASRNTFSEKMETEELVLLFDRGYELLNRKENK